MKFKVFLVLLISIFVFNISDVHASADVNDTSVLCVYDGASINIFNNVSGVPLLAPIVIPYSTGDVTIKASDSADEFLISVTFRYFDVGRLLSGGFDIDDIVQTVIKVKNGTYSVTDFLAQMENITDGSDSATITGYIQNGFTTVVNNKNLDPNLSKVTKNASTATYSSINNYGAVANNGICPPTIKVDVSVQNVANTFKIEDVTFENSSHATKRELYEQLFKNALQLYVSKTIVGGILTHSHFSPDRPYNNFTPSTCLSESEARYYTNQFNAIIKHASNPTYVTMFKNNGFSAIANSIVMNYMADGKCAKENPNLAGVYATLQQAANDALNVMNGTNRHTPTNQCNYILGDPNNNGDLAYYIDLTFRFIKFAAPLLLISLSIFDYIKAITASDAEAISKTNKKTVIRLIFAMLLFVLPIIISILLSLLGAQGSCNFNNIPGM